MDVMQAQRANLFLLEDLENPGKTSRLARSDLSALRSVADWIRTFVARPHKDLGRAGPVCPFVPGAMDRRTLWLAPEQIVGRSATDLVQRIDGYKQVLLRARPVEGDDTSYEAIVVVSPICRRIARKNSWKACRFRISRDCLTRKTGS
jgi:hypothetical protein